MDAESVSEMDNDQSERRLALSAFLRVLIGHIHLVLHLAGLLTSSPLYALFDPI